MKIAILDDYFDTLPTPPSSKTQGSRGYDFDDHVQDTDALAARLKDTECLVLTRERTAIQAACSNACPGSNLVPVIHRAAGDTKKAIRSAISSGSPYRPIPACIRSVCVA